MVSISGDKTPAHLDEAQLIVGVDDVDAQYERVARPTDTRVESPLDQPHVPLTFTVQEPRGYARTVWQGQATLPEII